MTSPNRVEFDHGAIAGNLAAIRQRIDPEMQIIASVKANAYGHGIVAVGRKLAAAGVEMLATGSYDDAVRLRQSGIRLPILMFGAALPPAVPAFREHDLIVTIHNRETAEAAIAAGSDPTPCFVKVDCGLGRLGVTLKHAHAFIADIARDPGLDLVGLYSHLPFADAAGRAWAQARTHRFGELLASLAAAGISIPITQIGASASIAAGNPDPCNAICPGGLLYGYAPFPEADMTGFRPVLSRIVTRLIQVSPDAADQTPGLEGRFAGRISGAAGVVPFGRVHGYRQAGAGQPAHMLIDGISAPVLGVSLEHCVIDLSSIPRARIGDDVVIVGTSGERAIALQDLAQWWDAGINDVLMAFNRRIEPT